MGIFPLLTKGKQKCQSHLVIQLNFIVQIPPHQLFKPSFLAQGLPNVVGFFVLLKLT